MNAEQNSTVVRDPGVWRKRCEALNTTILAHYEFFESAQKADPKIKILHDLVKRLKAFANDHFEFFFKLFVQESDGKYKYKSNTNLTDPPEYAFRATLDQVARDLEVIQRAANQRIWSSQEMKDTLDKADEFAKQAIQPLISLLDPKTTCITYFQKSPGIRIIPYASVVLIGIPFTCITTKQDFLAISHELGHYVFRKGIKDEERIYNKLYEKTKGAANGKKSDKANSTTNERKSDKTSGQKQILEQCKRWTEEIFADVCGCFISGAVMALDFQDLGLTCSQEDFVQDDRKHPASVLRPRVYTQVLEKMKDKLPDGNNAKTQWNELINSLDSRWDGLVQKRLSQGQIKIKSKTDNEDDEGVDIDQVISLTKIRTGTAKNKPVDIIIGRAFEILCQHLKPGENTQWSRHLGAWKLGPNCETLYDEPTNDDSQPDGAPGEPLSSDDQKAPLHYLIPWPKTPSPEDSTADGRTADMSGSTADANYEELWIKWLKGWAKDEGLLDQVTELKEHINKNATFHDKVLEQMETDRDPEKKGEKKKKWWVHLVSASGWTSGGGNAPWDP